MIKLNAFIKLKFDHGPILRQVDLANSLTIFGLLLSFAAILAAIKAHFHVALIGLIAAGIIDLIDGSVARRSLERTDLQAAVGEQLDGLVDLCAFGLTPSVFAYCFGLQTLFGCLILMFYLSMAVLRTAYFGIVGLTTERNQQTYLGLPTAYMAVFLPLLCLGQFLLSSAVMQGLLGGLFIGHAVLMVSPLQIFKLQGVLWAAFILGGVLLIGFYSWAIVAGL